MNYITTNVRLPEELWKALKIQAAKKGKRFSELVREALLSSLAQNTKVPPLLGEKICGLWKGASISDSLVEESKKALFSKALDNNNAT